MIVAVFGSIRITLSEADLERVCSIVRLGFTVLVSDADGADFQVQSMLLRCGYESVVVYHNGRRNGGPRHNLGNWPTVLVRGSYTDKDAAMCTAATAGLAFWNGHSTGTARNIEQMKGEGKKVRVTSARVSPPNRTDPAQDLVFSGLMEHAGGL